MMRRVNRSQVPSVGSWSGNIHCFPCAQTTGLEEIVTNSCWNKTNAKFCFVSVGIEMLRVHRNAAEASAVAFRIIVHNSYPRGATCFWRTISHHTHNHARSNPLKPSFTLRLLLTTVVISGFHIWQIAEKMIKWKETFSLKWNSVATNYICEELSNLRSKFRQTFSHVVFLSWQICVAAQQVIIRDKPGFRRHAEMPVENYCHKETHLCSWNSSSKVLSQASESNLFKKASARFFLESTQVIWVFSVGPLLTGLMKKNKKDMRRSAYKDITRVLLGGHMPTSVWFTTLQWPLRVTET